MSNNLVEEIAAKVAVLPLARQREALRFVETLAAKEQGTPGAEPFQSVRGLLRSDLRRLAEDLSEARAEMWRSFPREEPG